MKITAKVIFNTMAKTVDDIFDRIPRWDSNEIVYGYKPVNRGGSLEDERGIGSFGIFSSIHALDGQIGFQQITPEEYDMLVAFRVADYHNN